MLSTRVSTRFTGKVLSKTLSQIATGGLATRGTACVLLHQHSQNNRTFKTSSRPFFNVSPPKTIAEQEVKNLKEFKQRSWPHPVYSETEMKGIVSIHTAFRAFGCTKADDFCGRQLHIAKPKIGLIG